MYGITRLIRTLSTNISVGVAGKYVGLVCDYKDRMVSFGIHRAGDAASQEEAQDS